MLERTAIAAGLAAGGCLLAGQAHAQTSPRMQHNVEPPPRPLISQQPPRVRSPGEAVAPTPSPTPDALPEVHPVLGDVILGDPSAPVEIVEYGSITCAACQHFHATILPELKARYILTGEARFILRDYPTSPIPAANAGSAIARCAGAEKFYDVIADLFSRQSEVLAAARTAALGPVMAAVGERHGLSPAQVQACIQHEPTLAYIRREAERAPSQSLPPVILVNGQRVAEPTSAAIRSAVDQALETHRITEAALAAQAAAQAALEQSQPAPSPTDQPHN